MIMSSIGIKFLRHFGSTKNSILYPQKAIFYDLRLISTHRSHFCAAEEKSKSSNETKSDTQTASQDTDVLKELNEKIAKMQLEIEEFKDKYQRTLADRENVRNRLQNEIENAKLYSIQGFCKDLLEVTDVFRKAIECVPEDSLKEANSNSIFKNLYDGVVMTESQLINVLRRRGLAQIIPSVGDKFNPAEQEAMFEVPPSADNSTPGTVAHIVRNGWKLHERCIRSAQVGVFKD